MKPLIFINAFSVATPLGGSTEACAKNLFAGNQDGLRSVASLIDGRCARVGRVPLQFAASSSSDDGLRSTNNRLLLHCLREIEGEFREIAGPLSASRIGVVVGTSTSGMREAETAFYAWFRNSAWPDDYVFSTQELGDLALMLASAVGAGGPAYTVSTACSSSAKAMTAAARLILADICDVVLCGGADTLCDLTLNGFAALEAISPEVCNPFSRNRRGINLGEGAALFILSRVPSVLFLAGWGETSDAHHLSAPHPAGAGATAAMRQSLDMAGIEASDIGYINLHGTGTHLNDAMEARAVNRVFGPHTPCSSTKSLTGHMLGAAGACEAAFVAVALTSGGLLPPHRWDGDRDPELPYIALVERAEDRSAARYMMSCSYAFGGSNTVLILGKT